MGIALAALAAPNHTGARAAAVAVTSRSVHIA
jgi:hypothetical protein